MSSSEKPGNRENFTSMRSAYLIVFCALHVSVCIASTEDVDTVADSTTEEPLIENDVLPQSTNVTELSDAPVAVAEESGPEVTDENDEAVTVDEQEADIAPDNDNEAHVLEDEQTPELDSALIEDVAVDAQEQSEGSEVSQGDLGDDERRSFDQAEDYSLGSVGLDIDELDEDEQEAYDKMLSEMTHLIKYVAESLPLVQFFINVDQLDPDFEIYLSTVSNPEGLEAIEAAKAIAEIQRRIPALYVAIARRLTGIPVEYTASEIYNAYLSYGQTILDIGSPHAEAMQAVIDGYDPQPSDDSGESELGNDGGSENSSVDEVPVVQILAQPPNDKTTVFLRTWGPTAHARVHVYILHGMAEHSGRWEGVARALAGVGARVFCHDHKGHGKTAEAEGVKLGEFKEDDPVRAMIQDAKYIVESTNPDGLPWVILGHSAGSVITQGVLEGMKESEKLENLRGVVLSGPPATPSVVERWLMQVLLAILATLGCGQTIIRALTFRSFDRRMRSRLGLPFSRHGEWLTSDHDMIQSKDDDPYCGHPMSFCFWKSMVAQVGRTLRTSFVLPEDCKVLIVGGEDDACTNFGKSVRHEREKLSGHTNAKSVDQLMYSGCRHEWYSEKERDLMTQELVAWISDAVDDVVTDQEVWAPEGVEVE